VAKDVQPVPCHRQIEVCEVADCHHAATTTVWEREVGRDIAVCDQHELTAAEQAVVVRLVVGEGPAGPAVAA
jgi:hypothetical protein